MNLLKKLLGKNPHPTQHQRIEGEIVARESAAIQLVKYQEIEQARQKINTDWDTNSVETVNDRLNIICTVVGGFITRLNNLDATINGLPYGPFRTGMECVRDFFQKAHGSIPQVETRTVHHQYRCEVQVMKIRQQSADFFAQFMKRFDADSFMQNLDKNLAKTPYKQGASTQEILHYIEQKEQFISDVNTLVRYASTMVEQSRYCFWFLEEALQCPHPPQIIKIDAAATEAERDGHRIQAKNYYSDLLYHWTYQKLVKEGKSIPRGNYEGTGLPMETFGDAWIQALGLYQDENTQRGYTQALTILEITRPPMSKDDFTKAAQKMTARLEAFRKYVINTVQSN